MFGFGLGNVGVIGWVVIGIAVLLLVGTRGQIPQLMRDLGRGINSFRSGLKEGADESEEAKSKAAVEEKSEETVEVSAKEAETETEKKA